LAIFAPTIVAMTGSVRATKPLAGGVWKFLTLLFCCLTLASLWGPFSFIMSLVPWIASWVCAALALSAMRHQSADEQMLEARHERNELLRQRGLSANTKSSVKKPI